MRLRLVCCLLCVPLAARPGALPAAPISDSPAGQLRGRYSFRLEELERSCHRFILEAPGLELLYLEELVGLESRKRRLGVALPFAVAGPLAPQGLWRRLPNPLGHGPASPVHRESLALRLDRSWDAAARRGLALLLGCPGLPGLRGGLAVLEAPGPALQGGGWLEWGHPGSTDLAVLAACSLPPPAPATLDWLLPAPPYPGGELLHLAAGLSLDSGRAAFGWTGGLSGGPLVRPGLFSDLLLELRGPAWNLAALGGLCTPGYRVPAGEPCSRALRGALRLELSGRTGSAGAGLRRGPGPPGAPPADLPAWRLESELECIRHHPPAALRPDPQAELAELRLRGTVELLTRGEGRSLLLGLAGEGRRLRRAGGGALDCGELSVSACAETAASRLQGALDWRRSAEAEQELSLRLRAAAGRGTAAGSPRGAALGLRATLGLPEDAPAGRHGWTLGGALRGELARPGWMLFLELHTRRELRLGWGECAGPPGALAELGECLGITLGWDVRARQDP